MNINRYNRKSFRGFLYDLRLTLLDYFKVDIRDERRKQRMMDNMIETDRAFIAKVKAITRARFGSPRFKGYKE